jgi:phosphomannomutase
MVAVNSSTLLGRKVVSVERTNAAKFVFEDGFCILVRLSGAEASVRLYVEAESAKARENLTRAASDWILKGA